LPFILLSKHLSAMFMLLGLHKCNHVLSDQPPEFTLSDNFVRLAYFLDPRLAYTHAFISYPSGARDFDLKPLNAHKTSISRHGYGALDIPS
jgi:hypothetical protein